MSGPESVPLIILLVFYLYGLARWNVVRRPPLFFLGALGLLFALVGLFFTLGSSPAETVSRVFGIIGLLVAFAMAVLSCAGATVSMQGMLDAAKGAVPPSDASSGQ